MEIDQRKKVLEDSKKKNEQVLRGMAKTIREFWKQYEEKVINLEEVKNSNRQMKH